MADADSRLDMAREIEKQIAELEHNAGTEAAREELERLRVQLEALRHKPAGPPQDGQREPDGAADQRATGDDVHDRVPVSWRRGAGGSGAAPRCEAPAWD